MGFLLFLSILVSVNAVGRHTFMRTPTGHTFNLYLHPRKQLQPWPALWPRHAHTSGQGCPWMNRPMEEFLPDPPSGFRATRTGNLGVLWIWITAYKRWCRPWKGICLWPSEIPPPLEMHVADGTETAMLPLAKRRATGLTFNGNSRNAPTEHLTL